MDISDLILVGIGVAQRWPEIDLGQVTVRAMPKGTKEWVGVIYTPHSPAIFDNEPAALAHFERELVQLERFRFGDSEIRIGYGSETKHLVYALTDSNI